MLEIANPRHAAARLDDDEKDGVRLTDGIGRLQQTTIISEPGLYRLVMRSDKPEARRFQKWVVAEVIPSIRKTGGYGALAIDVRDPKQLAIITSQLLGVNLELREQVAVMAPKAAVYDHLSDGDGQFTLHWAAQVLRMPFSVLQRRLRRKGWLDTQDGYGIWHAARSAIEEGNLAEARMRIRRGDMSNPEASADLRPRLTSKGLMLLARELS